MSEVKSVAMTISQFREALIQMNELKPCKNLKGNDGRHSWQAEKVLQMDYETGQLSDVEALRCPHCRTVLMWPEDAP